MESTKQRGGKRTGSGRPKGKPHKVVSFRIRTEIAEEFKKNVQAFIDRF